MKDELNFRYNYLKGANLAGADLRGARHSNSTLFKAQELLCKASLTTWINQTEEEIENGSKTK